MQPYFCYLIVLFPCLGILSQADQGPVFVMTPSGDRYILLGQPLVINCTIQESSTGLYSARNLAIKRDSQMPSPDKLTIYETENTLQLHIANVSKHDKGQYWCYYNDTRKTFKMVYVGVPPRVPEKISCILYNFINMCCYFTQSSDENDLPTNWTISYRTGSDAAVTKTCHTVREPIVSVGCQAADDTDLVKTSTYYITVTGSNQLYDGFVISKSVEVYTNLSIVKPDLVGSLNFFKTNAARTVHLSWDFPAHLDTYIDLLYRLHIDGEHDWDTRTLLYKPPGNPRELGVLEVRYILDGLVPFCHYTVSVSSRPVTARGDLYRSDPAIVHFQTNQEIPERSTTLAVGSYVLVDIDSDFIGLALYWKNPGPRFSHGSITGYQILVIKPDTVFNPDPSSQRSSVQEVDIVTGYSDSSTHEVERLTVFMPVSQPVWVGNISGCRVSEMLDIELEKTQDYIIEMRPATEVGLSVVSSSLTIHSWSQASAVQPHRVIVELDPGNNRALLSWQLRNHTCDRLQNVTYYWCQPASDSLMTNTSFVECEDMFDWLTYPLEENCYNGSEHWVAMATTDVKFAVSLATDTIAGGMVWEKFRFSDYNSVPDEPLFYVDPTPDVTDRLTVTPVYNQQTPGGRPRSYHLFYRASSLLQRDFDCSRADDELMFPVDFDHPTLQIWHLQANTNYTVCLRGGNHAGKGHYGKPQTAVTIKPGGGVGKWLGVIIAGPLIAIVTFGLLLVLVKKLRKKMKPIAIMDIPIDPFKPVTRDTVTRLQETNITANNVHVPSHRDQGNDSNCLEENDYESLPVLPHRESLASTTGENSYCSSPVLSDHHHRETSAALSTYMRTDGIILPDQISCSSMDSSDHSENIFWQSLMDNVNGSGTYTEVIEMHNVGPGGKVIHLPPVVATDVDNTDIQPLSSSSAIVGDAVNDTQAPAKDETSADCESVIALDTGKDIINKHDSGKYIIQGENCQNHDIQNAAEFPEICVGNSRVKQKYGVAVSAEVNNAADCNKPLVSNGSATDYSKARLANDGLVYVAARDEASLYMRDEDHIGHASANGVPSQANLSVHQGNPTTFNENYESNTQDAGAILQSDLSNQTISNDDMVLNCTSSYVKAETFVYIPDIAFSDTNSETETQEGYIPTQAKHRPFEQRHNSESAEQHPNKIIKYDDDFVTEGSDTITDGNHLLYNGDQASAEITSYVTAEQFNGRGS